MWKLIGIVAAVCLLASVFVVGMFESAGRYYKDVKKQEDNEVD